MRIFASVRLKKAGLQGKIKKLSGELGRTNWRLGSREHNEEHIRVNKILDDFRFRQITHVDSLKQVSISTLSRTIILLHKMVIAIAVYHPPSYILFRVENIK